MKLRSLLRGILCVAALGATSPVCLCQPPSLEPRVPVAKSLAADGSILSRSRAGKAWQFVSKDEDLYSRDLLVCLPGLRADLEPRPESVLLSMRGNHPSLSSFSGLEAAVVLHDSRNFDLDCSLLRGRVVLTNKKAKGAAFVWLRLPEEAWQFTLEEPGTEIAIDLFGRWPRGVPFTRTPTEKDAPTRALVAIVLHGSVSVKTDSHEFSLSAPPGPAIFRWDSVGGAAATPQRLNQLPDWVRLPPSTDGKALMAITEAFRAGIKNKEPLAALAAELVAAEGEANTKAARLKREFAVSSLAALDQLGLVVEALADEKQADVRRAAIEALRHWIGDAAGRDQTLYQLLVSTGYSKGQAETILQMLHSPFEREKAETYDTLIAYLNHSKLAVRELAAWHLYRLVPAGRDIPYDAGASEEERDKSIQKWRKLIPPGKLPVER